MGNRNDGLGNQAMEGSDAMLRQAKKAAAHYHKIMGYTLISDSLGERGQMMAFFKEDGKDNGLRIVEVLPSTVEQGFPAVDGSNRSEFEMAGTTLLMSWHEPGQSFDTHFDRLACIMTARQRAWLRIERNASFRDR